MSLEPVTDAIKENQRRAPYLSEWRHVKSGKVYVVRMHAIIEATLEPAVIYYRKHAAPEETWCRPALEFFDGRFEPTWWTQEEIDEAKRLGAERNAKINWE